MNWIKRTFLAAAAVIFAIPVGAAELSKPVGWLDKEKKTEETDILTDDFTPRRGNRSPVCDEKMRERSDTKENAESETTKNAQTTLSNNTDNTSQSWYCKHMTNGERPPIPAEMSYLEKYDGYYLGENEKVIYLTFDAGYENGNVEKILDVLKAEDVPGAFFILDNLVMKNTDLVKRMVEEGHTVCNHTAKHRDMTKMTSKENFAAELTAMETLYREKTGYDLAKFYRPPEGKLNEQNLAWAQELGYKTIMWSFAYADWDNDRQMSPEKAAAKLLDGTHNGEVLLLHPTSSTNAEILSGMIQKWKEMGYRFGTIEELTKSGDKA